MWLDIGPVTPGSDEAPSVGAVRGFRDQRIGRSDDSGIPPVDQQVVPAVEDCKRFATLRAQAALGGWMLKHSDDGLVASRWGESRALPELPAAEAFLRHVGVNA
jgi:hypothetical protein